jgi:iron complex outermembrane receptor protein
MGHFVRSGFAGLALWFVCWSSVAAQQVGALRGKVSNKETGTPVSGAVVALRETSYRAQTGDKGTFVLSGIREGEYTFAATAIGMAPSTARVTIRAGATTELEIAMTPAPTNLRDVVVTASKTETEVRDVPAAVSLLSGAEIIQSGATNFTEAIKTVPGVSMGSFGENFNSIQLRGLPRFGNENEAVLVLLDGVPQTDARNSAQLLTLPIENIDHVEVVKGPNSALYGRTAIGGVVNIITEEPGAEQHFRAQFQGGQWGFVRGALTASGPLAPGSRSGYVLSFVGDRHESFHDVNAYSRRESSLFGKFTTALDAATQVVVSTNYAINRGGTPAGDPIVNGQLLSDIDPTFSRFTNLNLPSAQYNEEHLRTMARIQRNFGATANLSNTIGYRHDLWNVIDDGDFLTGPSLPSDTVVLFPFTRPREENAYYDDLRLELNLGSPNFRHRVLVGGTLDRNTGSVATQFPYTDTVSFGVPIDYKAPVFPGPTAFQQIDLGSRTYQGTLYGAYVQDEITVMRRLRLNVGVRYDYNKIHARTSDGTDIAGSFHKFTPKAGATFRLLDSDDPRAPQVSVYAQYGRAFKPPNAPAELAVALDPNRPLVPENITNYEAGVKATLLQGRLGFETSVFDMLRDGIPILLRVGNGLDFQESPAGKQHFKGVEAGLVVRPTTPVSFHVNYAFYDGKYEDFQIVANDQPVNLSGLRVNLSPRHSLNVGANYERDSGLGVTLAGYYEGNKALDPKNTYFLGSYFAVNGRVSWRWRNYTLAVASTNLFNKKYATDGEISSVLYVFPAAPRRITGEFAVAF